MRTMLLIIEFTYTDYFMKIVLRFQDIIVQYEFYIVDCAVVNIFPVTSLIDTINPGFCQAYLAYFPVAVYESVSWAKKAVIVKRDNCGNSELSENR